VAAPPAAAPVAAAVQRAAPTPAAPLLRTPAPRAVATATASLSGDEPPWGDEEPDVLVDDLPAPMRGRVTGSRPAPPLLQRGRPAPDEVEPVDIDDASAPRAATPAFAPPPVLPSFERTELGTRWHALISQCAAAGKLVAMVRALAMQSELIECGTEGDTPTWRLRVSLETLRNPALADKLAAILSELTGESVRLAVEMGDAQDTPLKRDAAEADRRQRAAIDEIQSDATVRALLAQFQTARILPGSVKPL
jgi:DNA polymerase-3 subunit gamma/tau